MKLGAICAALLAIASAHPAGAVAKRAGTATPPIPIVALPPIEIIPFIVPPCCTIPALTPVRIEIVPGISSALNKAGEHFEIRLVTAIDLGSGLHIPAGASGMGEIVHAAKSRFGGKAGELVLAARYLDYNKVHIPLRSLSFGAGSGRDNTGTATAVAIAGGAFGGVISMFITGGEVVIPPGTNAFAKISAPTVVPIRTAQ